MSTAIASFSLVNAKDSNDAMSVFVAWMTGGKRTPQEIAEAQTILAEFNAADRAAAIAAATPQFEMGAVYTWHVTPNGTISLYGLSKQFPVALYAEQWLRLFTSRKAILATIEKLVANKTVSLRSPGKYSASFAAAVAGDGECEHKGSRERKAKRDA